MEGMSFEKAVEVLAIEKGVAELDLSNGVGGKHHEEFVEAVNTVFRFIHDVLQINKIGK